MMIYVLGKEMALDIHRSLIMKIVQNMQNMQNMQNVQNMQNLPKMQNVPISIINSQNFRIIEPRGL